MPKDVEHRVDAGRKSGLKSGLSMAQSEAPNKPDINTSSPTGKLIPEKNKM
jgi:hypothetical protein